MVGSLPLGRFDAEICAYQRGNVIERPTVLECDTIAAHEPEISKSNDYTAHISDARCWYFQGKQMAGLQRFMISTGTNKS